MADQQPNPQQQARKQKANMDDRTKSTIIIAFTHVKRQMNESIFNPKVTSNMIRKVIELLKDREFMGEPMKLEDIPSETSIRHSWNMYIETGRVYKERKGGRPLNAHRQEAYDKMVSDDISTRTVSNVLGNISYRTVHRMVKQKKMRFYRTPRGQYMPDGNPDRLLNFANTIKRLVCEQSIDVANICFSDECQIYTGRHINRQNTGFWRLRGFFTDRQQKLVQKRLQGPKTHMFVLLHWQAGVIGPIFIEDMKCPDDNRVTLSSRRYCYMLETMVIPELKARLGSKFETCWWMQDGASSHTAGPTLEFLRQHFGPRIISNKSAIEWPPYSPDLNPLDYWFWSHLKKAVGFNDPKTVSEVKTLATGICQDTTELEIRNAIDDFLVRIDCMEFYQGQHFEAQLKAFKNRFKRTPCDFCEKIHACSCESCSDRCLEIYEQEQEQLQDEAMDADDGDSDASDISDLDFDQLELLN